ncbi:MAG: nodulation protein NodH [Rhodobacter sp.]|nr:nodulation protein NodH [Rhodobacter sp.]
MADRFDYFVMFAEMRTGSNFLEENLNEYPGLSCLGELFNPHFIGGAKKFEMYGVNMAARESDPFVLLDRIRTHTDGLPGFRFFHDHDPRILGRILPDTRCAKIILTRNPADSYVSRKIAAETGQWRLSDLKRAKSAQIAFDRDEFEAHLEQMQAFQLKLLHGLQTTGQTAFYIGYDDLADLAVLDGLARFLGVDHQKSNPSQATKVQNPAALEEKVTNFPEMEAALARIDRFDLTRTPNFEPRRAPSVPHYVAGAASPLLFQPVRGGPDDRVLTWLAALDGRDTQDLQRGFTQKSLRHWKRQHKGHRAFTVVRHPVQRLHRTFARHILSPGPACFADIRETLRKHYKLAIPKDAPGPGYSAEAHHAAFLAFAKWVAGNLNGQTSQRVDASWASQSEIVQGMAAVQLPDMVIREDRLQPGLDHLASLIGVVSSPVPDWVDDAPVPLAAYYDAEVEAAVRAAYQRDYMMFGFRPWGAT